MVDGRDEGGGTGSARRRSERRSVPQHERMAVAVAVAEARHHSSRAHKTATAIREEVVQVTHKAPRRQKTPPPEARPDILAEPGLQRSDRTVRLWQQRRPRSTLLRSAGSLNALSTSSGGRKTRRGCNICRSARLGWRSSCRSRTRRGCVVGVVEEEEETARTGKSGHYFHDQWFDNEYIFIRQSFWKMSMYSALCLV